MKIFWENIKRYPRFFISSVMGLTILLFGDIIKQSPEGFKNKIIYFFVMTWVIGVLIFSFSLIFNV